MIHDIHLGVTGLRRSGKTVFLTSLIYQLLQRGSKGLDAFKNRKIELQPGRIDSESSAFPYDEYLAVLRSAKPDWPKPTTKESLLTIECSYVAKPTDGRLTKIVRRAFHSEHLRRGWVRIHLHDYPGEFLLDLSLPPDYCAWSENTLHHIYGIQRLPAIAEYEQEAKDIIAGHGTADVESVLPLLRAAYGRYVLKARNRGMEYLQPGADLCGWDEDSATPCPASFVPLPQTVSDDSPLHQAMTEAYRQFLATKVAPFRGRLHESTCQIVLVDVLKILSNGVDCFNDTKKCVENIILAYSYNDGWRASAQWLPAIIRPRKHVDRVLFAATKADHATNSHRANLKRLLEDMVNKAKAPIASSINHIDYEWFTSIRCTEDRQAKLNGFSHEVLVGRRIELPGDDPKKGFFPGDVPSEWPQPKADGTDAWPFGCENYRFPAYLPGPLPLNDIAPWPHLNLDRILWALLSGCF